MLCLKNKSNPEWINNAIKNIDSILIDHAHCEKKAALTGMNILNKYPDKVRLSIKMSELVIEEMQHYQSVIKIIEKRKIIFQRDNGDEYAKNLFKQLRKNHPHQMMDHLLIAGIIEARSTERMKLLSDNIEDNLLKNFYKELVISEAGHYMSFIKLADFYFETQLVNSRLSELSLLESKIVSELPNIALMHG